MAKKPAKADHKFAGKTEYEVERGLMALIRSSGNGHEASRFLEEDGLTISPNTLYRWKRGKHAARYLELRQEFGKDIREQAADDHWSKAAIYAEAEEKLTEKLLKEYENIPIRDVPASIRNIATSRAISTDKALILEGQPTERKAVDVQGLIKELTGMGMQIESGPAKQATEPELELTEGDTSESDDPAP